MLNYLDIIKRVQEKDQEAVTLLYNSYGKRLYGYGRQHWDLSEDEAWEAVYKTLEALINKGKNYPFESQVHFDNYLLKVYINFLRQAYRSKLSKTNQTMEYVDLSNETDLPESISEQLNQDALASFEKPEISNWGMLNSLKEALDQLDATDRELLLLRVQNYSYEEISEFLQIENRQLKVKYHRAKQKLADKLKEIAIKK